MAVLRTLTDPMEQSALLLSARNTRAIYLGLFPEPGWREPSQER
jgi:hypothetical protein